MPRHSPALPELDDASGRTGTYRPQRLEVRTRRAPKAPLWTRLCLAGGVALLLAAAVLAVLVSVTG